MANTRDTLRRLRADLARLEGKRSEILRTIDDASAAVAAHEANAARHLAIGDGPAAAEERAARDRVAAYRAAQHAALGRLDEAARLALDRGLVEVDPGDADPTVPLVLMPVRIETRYTADRAALRVRIFPDDIHIDSLDRGLSDAEREAGVAYWTQAWRATAEVADAAWSTLLAQVGQRRAAWVATALVPTNLDPLANEPAPLFPQVPPRERRPAVARLLPDTFTVVAIQGGLRSEQRGSAVLPELVVGLFGADGAPRREINGVQVPAGGEWMADYGEAERVGMAVTVALRRPGEKVDRLLVYGIRNSHDPMASAAALESLLDAHRCSQGIAFVAQGTPTNNTEDERPGWQRGAATRRPVVGAAPAPGSNAAVLASALGIDAAVLGAVDGAQGIEQPLAQAMNVALWGPSWGAFLDKINRVGNNGPTLTDAAREQARRFHRDHVRGRGPLPAVRVGDQPYGIVPVSSAERWTTRRADDFELELRGLLEKLRTRWRQCIAKVPRLGHGPIDEVLLELLGSSAVCLSLRARPIVSSALATIGVEAGGADEATLKVERLIEDLLWEELHNASLVHPAGSFGASRHLGLPMVHDSDSAFVGALLDGEPPTAQSIFQVLIELAWDHARRAVDKDGAEGRLPLVAAQASALTSADRERALSLANNAESVSGAALFAEAGRISEAFTGPAPTHAQFQPVAWAARSFSQLALESTHEQARAELSLFGMHAWFASRGRFNELRDALRTLRATDLEQRRLLLAETLDTASHRLDAWLTAVVDRRLRALRAVRPRGLTIGAYGWVEDVEPMDARRDDGGFVHAPSVTHAATAAILRSGYLSHNPDAGGDGAFAIDLTSARVRTALHLVGGVRQGQPLGALLGYRIERGLHEAGLERFVLALRRIAPLIQGRLSDRGDALAPDAKEAIAAANVVDGIALVEQWQGKVKDASPATIRATLDAAPANNPYLTGAWQPTTAAEWERIGRIVDDAIAALDAASDMLLAESVHMLVAGSPTRAGAALDAAGGGDVPPPEPQFVVTPSEGALYTHRLLAVLGEATAWNTIRPRSTAEPRLEGWAASRLGDPATIAIGRRGDDLPVTVADTNLCALDLVYEAGTRDTFAACLAAALPPGAVLDMGVVVEGQRTAADTFELASSLRALLVRARPATPHDLALANSAALRAYDHADLDAARQRAQSARDLLDLRRAVLEGLIEDAASTIAQYRAAIDDLAAFGLAAAAGLTDDQLSAAAPLVAADARRRVQAATQRLGAAVTAESVAEAGQAVFGEGFWILCPIAAPVGVDAWTAALAAAPADATAGAIRRFLVDYASVRDGVRRHAECMLLQEAVGAPANLRVAQLSGAYGTQPSGWVGAPLDPATPTPDAPTLSAILDVGGAYDGGASTAALVIDEWVERIALRERRGDEPEASIDERVTTGVSFNAMAPSARAPQAILLAVSPDHKRWTGEAIVQTLEETLELAKMRAVTLERTNGIARILPALYQQSYSLQGEKSLDFGALPAVSSNFADMTAYIKEL